jgi:hypothetical protein
MTGHKARNSREYYNPSDLRLSIDCANGGADRNQWATKILFPNLFDLTASKSKDHPARPNYFDTGQYFHLLKGGGNRARVKIAFPTLPARAMGSLCLVNWLFGFLKIFS